MCLVGHFSTLDYLTAGGPGVGSRLRLTNSDYYSIKRHSRNTDYTLLELNFTDHRTVSDGTYTKTGQSVRP